LRGECDYPAALAVVLDAEGKPQAASKSTRQRRLAECSALAQAYCQAAGLLDGERTALAPTLDGQPTYPVALAPEPQAWTPAPAVQLTVDQWERVERATEADLLGR
jgi:hypothetical protein